MGRPTGNTNSIGRRNRPAARAAFRCLLVAGLVLTTGSSGISIVIAQTSVAEQSVGPIFNRDDPLWVDEDNLDIDRPADWGVYELYDVYENLFQDPGDASDIRALNINTLGEVPDSSWFHNRLGVHDMGLDEIAVGPNLTGPPAEGDWTVIGRPGGGVTPKMLIEDERGQRFVIKFDPVDYPEIASGAEMISSKIFYAAGYHVAEAYIVTLNKDRLVIGEDASFTTDVGERRQIDQIDIDHWMSNAPVRPDGTYRALASKFVPGEPVGEFRFFGTRPDDPNDIFPHEHRRELRGYRVFSAWVNHDDSRALNTYDSYVEQDGRRYIKHYLLDFGSTLGSASIGANEPRSGHEYFLESGPVWKSALSLGIWHRPWLSADMPDIPAIGNIEAEYFVAELWKPEYPNAAFDNMDAADAFWAARILAMFTDEVVAAIVAEAQYTDPRAVEYANTVLRARRDKAVNTWIAGANPIDALELTGAGEMLTLEWDNAALRVGAATGTARYDVRWSSFDNLTGEEETIAAREVNDPAIGVPTDGWGPRDDFGFRYSRARIGTVHPDFPGWRQPLVVTLRLRGDQGIDIVGIERPR